MRTTRTTSITELRDHLAVFLDSLEQNGPVMILRHSKPAAYLVPPAFFDALLESLEDAEDARELALAAQDLRQGLAVPAEEVFSRLGL